MKDNKRELCWVSIRAKEVLPNYNISGTLATHPRFITKIVENDDGTLTFWEKFGGKENIYHENVDKEHRFDLLVFCDSHEPVLEYFYE